MAGDAAEVPRRARNCSVVGTWTGSSDVTSSSGGDDRRPQRPSAPARRHLKPHFALVVPTVVQRSPCLKQPLVQLPL
jgi:hypothetical protein